MDALTHEFRTQSFIFILWFISKFLVTWCEQLLDLKELPKLKVSDGSHLSVVLSLWCLCFLSLIPVLSFFCIPVIKNIRQTGTAFRPRSSRFWSRAFAQRVALMCGALDSHTPHYIYRSVVDVGSEEYRSTECVTVDCIKSQGLTPQEVLKIKTTYLEFVI